MAYLYGDGNKSHSSCDTLLTSCLSVLDISSICAIIFQIIALKFYLPTRQTKHNDTLSNVCKALGRYCIWLSLLKHNLEKNVPNSTFKTQDWRWKWRTRSVKTEYFIWCMKEDFQIYIKKHHALPKQYEICILYCKDIEKQVSFHSKTQHKNQLLKMLVQCGNSSFQYSNEILFWYCWLILFWTFKYHTSYSI